MPRKVEVRQVVEEFNQERKYEVSKSTWRNYQYPLKEFIKFCDRKDIEYVNDLTGYDLKQFKRYRREAGIKTVTLKNNLSSLRVFLRWCRDAELVDPDLPELVTLPNLTKEDQVSGEVLEEDRVNATLDYLRRFEYATLRHALFLFMFHTCSRIGTVQAIDLDDYHPMAGYVEIRHRPETGTPLKNGESAQRQVALASDVVEVLEDYIEVHRKPVKDEHGREPLFTSVKGRVSGTTIRKNMYALTRPCHIGQGCPHDREEADCEATTYEFARNCPSSMSPHPIRRAAITYHLNQEWPKDKLSERANVSGDVMDKHYDSRSEREKRKTRRRYLDNL